jgi:hypothetical protein
MFVRQASDGNWYVTKYEGKQTSGKKVTRNWFFCRYHQLTIKNISWPKEFLGKRVRLKVEIIDDEKLS